MKNSIIIGALNKAAGQLAKSLGISIEFNGYQASAVTWLRLQGYFLPSDNADIDMAGDATSARGIYQINIVSPIAAGTKSAYEIADKVAAYFPANTEITAGGLSIWTDGTPDSSPPIPNGTDNIISVSVPYSVNIVSLP